MTFKVEPLTSSDLDSIYSSPIGDAIAQASEMKRHAWPAFKVFGSWSVDPDRQAFLILLPVQNERPMGRYLFAFRQGAMRLLKRGYCRFSVEYASTPMDGLEGEIETLIKDAFRVGGELIDGTTDPNDEMAVPDLTLEWSAHR